MGISTHILDTSRGRPAADVAVSLEWLGANGYELLGEGRTDADGRQRTLVPLDAEGKPRVRAGRYRINFAVGAYFAARNEKSFYPSVSIEFEIDAPDEHYHVPLLLNPFGFSTYRGS